MLNPLILFGITYEVTGRNVSYYSFKLMLRLSIKMQQGAAAVDYANVLMHSIQNLFLSFNISILVKKGQ